jgi:hypothetical protein
VHGVDVGVVVDGNGLGMFSVVPGECDGMLIAFVFCSIICL